MDCLEIFLDMIGTAGPMEQVRRLMSQVAGTESTVLLLGETGTGKGLVAKSIHQSSLRKNEVMITVDCAALPPDLIESELFGHEKGSFTGALERRIGKWELADKGTLFLDEIGEMPYATQAKILRAIQEREIERIGGNSTIKTDVRIISATSKDLAGEVRKGRFRSDLFFRLNVFPIVLPPLRERRQDIHELVSYFLKKYSEKSGRKVSRISSKVQKKLLSYHWPGNVRELENLIERSVLLTTQSVIDEVFLPVGYQKEGLKRNIGKVKTINEVVREHILMVLTLCEGKIAGDGGAAEVLKIPPTTLHAMIKRLVIKKVYER
ncbi:Formate hydrogenlyase transcriptional activator FhlA [Dyadobacter sp. CECT 9275]|uniref:Formate hydrogenlyase transcriptional activator FhlA n=1 Tax=Dyadobacter helix TaxID=2822344 RepID=A0A916J9N6_9BACT|nr:sigma-54 dependent transcriptional regulator [Dyadobacter sp. CECT 9275]CAG4992599.1 Formate hydrogenlyase transcriptional activator FhlA [Dyadobacter sp. CECT 9275]